MAPGHHRDFKEGISHLQFRESRLAVAKEVRENKFKKRIAHQRRRRATKTTFRRPDDDDETMRRPSQEDNPVSATTTGGIEPSPIDINRTLVSFIESQENVDLALLTRQAEAANELASNGSDHDKMMLLSHGFLYNVGKAGLPFLRNRAHDAIRYIVLALRKLLSKENAHVAASNVELVMWLIRLLHQDNGLINENAATLIGCLAHQNVALSNKLLLTPLFVEPLIRVFKYPTDEDGVYQPKVVAAVVSTVHVIFDAVNMEDQTDVLPEQIKDLAKAAVVHFDNLWRFPRAYKLHKDMYRDFIRLLDAAFKHGHTTTKLLADDVVDYTVLVKILTCNYYNYYHLGLTMILPVLSCFANITSLEDPEYVDKVIDWGFLSVCSAFLNMQKPETKRQQAEFRKLERELFLSMANIAAGTCIQVQTMLNFDETIRGKIIEHAAFHPKRHISSFETALWVLVNSVTQGTDSDVILLVSEGGLKPIVDYLMKESAAFRRYRDLPLGKVALEALVRILQLRSRLESPDLECLHDIELLNKMDDIMESYDEVLHPPAIFAKSLLEILSEDPMPRSDKVVKRLF